MNSHGPELNSIRGRGQVVRCPVWMRAAPVLLIVALLITAMSSESQGQTSLGGQRIGTSSGTFLKIGLDARSAALGGAAISVVQGPGAVFVNPAGILAERGGTSLYLTTMQWPADIQVSGACLSQSLPSIDSQLALAMAYLGTNFEETTEFYSQGTGRTVEYSDFFATLAFARHLTDRLAVGVAGKYFREDLGSNLGGPTTAEFLLDAGSNFSLGYRNARLSIALTNFGSDLKPQGSFLSHVSGAPSAYTAFSPPTQFQLGFSVDPYIAKTRSLTTVIQISHQSDKQETVRAGVEYWMKSMYAARVGYDLAADEMGLSAGLGLKVRLSNRPAMVDYAYTEGGHLAAVHRWSLSFGF